MAFAALYRAHAGAVARVVGDNVHDPEGVADVVQEVFVRALERLPSLRDPQRFRPWLLAIARHAAIDQRRAQRQGTEDLGARDSEPTAPGPGPDELAEVRELARLVEGCVAGLSARDATALTLVTQLGFTPAEMAAALGVSVGAAKVIVHRARRRLRDALALELMVRRPTVRCGTLAQLLNANRLVQAARHLRSCPDCASDVRDEVTLYQARPMNHSGSSPTTRTPLSRSASASAAAKPALDHDTPKPSTSSSRA